MKKLLAISFMLALGSMAMAQMPGVDIRPADGGTIVRRSSDNMVSNFDPTLASAPLRVNDVCFDRRRGALYRWNSVSWQLFFGRDDGQQADVAYTVTNPASNIATGWDAALYNKLLVHYTIAGPDTMRIDLPTNSTQNIGEIFVVDINMTSRTMDADTLLIHFDSLFRTYDGKLLTEWKCPPRGRIQMAFRVHIAVEGNQWVQVDDILGSYQHTGGGGGGEVNMGRVLYVAKTGNNATAEVGNPDKPWADPETAVSAMVNGDRLQVMAPDTFRLLDGIYLDSLQNVELDFAASTLMWETVTRRITTLTSAYVSGNSITVASVPAGWSVGDNIRLCIDTTDATGISRPATIASIVGNVVTITAANFLERYTTNVFTAPSGAKVVKDYKLIWGRAALSGDGPVGVNNSITIKNLIVDGEWHLGKPHENYSWHYNSILFLNGRNCIIENSKFLNYSNEAATGTGMNFYNCDFMDGGGSGFHYSACDEAQHDAFTRGVTIINCRFKRTNQIADLITGHSDAAITFSCNGGDINIIGCEFEHNKIVPKGILGIVTGAEGTSFDRENITFSGNRCYHWNRIVQLDASSHSVNLSGNIFFDCGAFSTNNATLDTIPTINICGNTLAGGTTFDLADIHRCQPNNRLLYGSRGKVVVADYYTSPLFRRNLEATGGNLFLSGTFNSNYVQFESPAKTRVMRLANQLWTHGASFTPDSLVAWGMSNSVLFSFTQSGGNSWKESFAFDQAGNTSADKYAKFTFFGNLNDTRGAGSNIYGLNEFQLNLNGSTGGRRYALWEVGEKATINLTGTRNDTLEGLYWNPPVNSTGGGFNNWPIDFYSGKSWWRTGTEMHAQGKLFDRSGSAGTAGQVPTADASGWLWGAVDPSATNEGSLTVTAATSNSSNIHSNTSGSTDVEIGGDANTLVTENTGTGDITISANQPVIITLSPIGFNDSLKTTGVLPNDYFTIPAAWNGWTVKSVVWGVRYAGAGTGNLVVGFDIYNNASPRVGTFSNVLAGNFTATDVEKVVAGGGQTVLTGQLWVPRISTDTIVTHPVGLTCTIVLQPQ